MKQSACEIMKIKNVYTHQLNYFKTSLLFLFTLFSLNFTIFSQSSAIKTIVIDAGHGGKDPGCHGAFSNEKHVCLSMALKLGKKIKKNFPELNVLYTRDTDVFVELHERANIANKANADLFICIHANAASPAAYGTETYVLGLHRTEAQKNVAERENSIIHLEKDQGKRYENFDMSPDALIARKIQLSVFLDQSISFAQKLQRQFKNIGRHSRGVKQAGFLVLYKTTMPSVLIETGFLTNKKEEKFLAADEGQNKMVSAMFKAFVDHKNELEGVDKNVEKLVNKNNLDPDESIEINNEDENINSSDIVFRVQIATSSKKLNLNSSQFKGLKVYEYFHNGSYKYTTGVFISNFIDANIHRDKMRKLGFKSSFVVCFKGDDRINLQKGIKLAEK